MIKRLKIGVTGGLASGKSTVCKMLAERGYPVIIADDVAKELLQSDAKIKEEIVSAFGKEAYKDGLPNKEFLAQQVFRNAEKLMKINSIIHPPTMGKISDMMGEYLKKNDVVFVESAIIFEANLEEYFDNVLLVASPNNNKVERVVKNGKMSEEDARSRLANQIPDSKKKELADFVIQNDKSVEELKTRTEFFLTIFRQLMS